MMEIRIDTIKIGKRIRSLNNEKVIEIADSINEIGLLNSISVRSVNSHYELVSGLHRLKAFELLGRETIPAVIFEGDDSDVELAEIDENLKRCDLTVLEQGEHLVRREEILKQRGERAQVGDNQFIGGGETVSLPKTTADIASEIGLSERSTQQRLQIARDITPEVKDVIRDKDIADSTGQLLRLARMNPEDQMEETQYLLQEHYDKRIKKMNLALLHTGDQESYTPSVYIEAARAVMGSIDTDPASNEIAQETIKAGVFYTSENDGLTKEWKGNIFLNPPYSQPEIKDFIDKLLTELAPGKQAILLTNNNTDTNWFHDAAKRAIAICFTKGRINFYKANGDITNPTNGQTFFYFGSNKEKFVSIFGEFGLIMKVI